MRNRQHGGVIANLVVVAIVVGLGYYAYKEFVTQPAAPPSCKALLNSCITNCRKTTSEAPAMQACQDKCNADNAACEAKKR